MRSDPPSRRQLEMLETNDLGVLEEISNSAGWDVRYVQMGPGRPSANVLSTTVDDLIVQRERWGRSIHIAGYGPPGLTVFGLLSGGDGASHFQGRDISPDDLLISNPGEEIDFIGPSGMECITFFVSPERLQEMTRVLELPNSPLVDGSSRTRLSPRYAKALRRLLHKATTEEPDSLRPGEEACRILELLCLATKHSSDPEYRSGDVLTRTRHAKVARDYIEEHLQQPLFNNPCVWKTYARPPAWESVPSSGASRNSTA